MNKQLDLNAPSGELSTKDKLILEGIKLFSKHGFDGTTTRMLAEAIGANNAVVYFHFKSKENLYAEVLHYVAEKARLYFQPLQDEILKSYEDKELTSEEAWICIEKFIDLYINLLQDEDRKEELYLLLQEELNPANGERPITLVACRGAENLLKHLLMTYWECGNYQTACIASRLVISSLVALTEHPTFLKLSLQLKPEEDLPASAWDDIRSYTLNSIKSYKNVL